MKTMNDASISHAHDRALRELALPARLRGHSLVELLAVVVMLAVIAAVVFARFGNYTAEGHESACYVIQGEIEVQAQLWYRDQAAWPAANLSGFGSNTKYFPDGHLPLCPTGGVYSFNSLTGEVSCTHHP